MYYTEYLIICYNVWVRVIVFNAIFNNISVILWQSVLLVEETRVPRENHRISQVTDKLYHIKSRQKVSGDRLVLNWHIICFWLVFTLLNVFVLHIFVLTFVVLLDIFCLIFRVWYRVWQSYDNARMSFHYNWDIYK
jgi:Flp pilus assembly protein TadB